MPFNDGDFLLPKISFRGHVARGVHLKDEEDARCAYHGLKRNAEPLRLPGESHGDGRIAELQAVTERHERLKRRIARLRRTFNRNRNRPPSPAREAALVAEIVELEAEHAAISAAYARLYGDDKGRRR